MNSVKNSVQLIGHMGADPVMKTLENGAKVARLSIATTERYKGKKGEWMEETTWHNVVAWESLAEKAEQHLHKGAHVLIAGKLINRSYVDSKGDKKYIYEVKANAIVALDKKVNLPEKEQVLEKEDLPF